MLHIPRIVGGRIAGALSSTTHARRTSLTSPDTPAGEDGCIEAQQEACALSEAGTKAARHTAAETRAERQALMKVEGTSAVEVHAVLRPGEEPTPKEAAVTDKQAHTEAGIEEETLKKKEVEIETTTGNSAIATQTRTEIGPLIDAAVRPNGAAEEGDKARADAASSGASAALQTRKTEVQVATADDSLANKEAARTQAEGATVTRAHAPDAAAIEAKALALQDVSDAQSLLRELLRCPVLFPHFLRQFVFGGVSEYVAFV